MRIWIQLVDPAQRRQLAESDVRRRASSFLLLLLTDEQSLGFGAAASRTRQHVGVCREHEQAEQRRVYGFKGTQPAQAAHF